MNEGLLRLHAYGGRENGLMIIGTEAALVQLAQELQRAASFQHPPDSAGWPRPVVTVNAASPYIDAPDFRLTFHVQREPLSETLLAPSRRGPPVPLVLAAIGLAGVGAVQVIAWLLRLV